ncbi:MAG TPA: 4-alpha-glucanotransferase [Longimicrobiales bacterium]|nr:4-alpha-glucanotransferase [Longimicrobiales bacterium]
MTRYTDAAGEQREADDEALLAVLGLLGAPVGAAADAPAAIRELGLTRARRALPWSIVAWEHDPIVLTLRLPSRERLPFRLEVCLEDGEARTIELTERALLGRLEERVEGEARIVWRFRIEDRLPTGYHRLHWKDEADATLLIAPLEVHPGAPAIAGNRAWGVFMPVYAMRRSGARKPIGDLDDLAALSEWVVERGGHVVSTLPMLAATSEEPSPYSPVSRLFWNEAFLGAGKQGDGVGFAGRSGEEGLIDYEVALAAARARLEGEIVADYADGEPGVVREFHRLRPDVEDYARFRATVERRGESWWSWPDRMRDGELRPGDYDEGAYRYHVYAQARMHERLRELARTTRAAGAGLYLDLPLGVHADGYDVWRYRDRFAAGASVGAPPDPFFTRGQDWGFPPLRPDGMRETGFEYTIATIRNHLRYAGVLRLDHVMGLHRQFWVPNGMEAARGVYVRYPARELYAILSIESHRCGAAIVGENLGTVPENVTRGMRAHAVRGMHVVQFEVAPERSPAVAEPFPGDVASLNTHDMPTFTTFWTGRDLRQRMEWGLLEEDAAVQASHARRRIREAAAAELGLPDPEDAGAATRAWLERLAASDAALVLVSLEDLWGELEPHNVPGTWRDMPNWRRRSRLTLEELDEQPEVTSTIEAIDRLRRGKAS